MITRMPRAWAWRSSSRNSLSAAVQCQVCGSLVSLAISCEVARRIGAEIRIDVMERVAVVLVQRAGVEHRIEIDRVDAEVLQDNRA